MKKFKYTWALSLLIVCTTFTACNSDDDYFSKDAQKKTITINKVYLEDVDSSVEDREVTFGRLGQILRFEGSGLYGVKYVYVNGYDTYFNRAYVSDHSMMIQLDSDTPIADADESVRNTIRFVKDNTETTFEFDIRAASPTISSINNTLPREGETVIVYGSNLHETTLAVLPDGTQVTDIVSDVDGKWYSFTMPSVSSQGGSIVSYGTNGTAQTPAYFNFSDCIILDFDGHGNQSYWSWSETGSMINDEDLVDDPLSSGRGKCFQVIPERLIQAGGIVSNKSRATECWTVGAGDEDESWWDNWMYTAIPSSTLLSNMAFQFDIYVSPSEPWTTCGEIEVCFINNYNLGGIASDDNNAQNLVAFYVPYVQGGAIVDFSTEGWQTVSIPLSDINKYATAIADGDAPTFADLNADRDAATYPNFGMGFANTDFTYSGVDVVAETFATHIYVDNWRLVPYEFFVISDFDDEE